MLVRTPSGEARESMSDGGVDSLTFVFAVVVVVVEADTAAEERVPRWLGWAVVVEEKELQMDDECRWSGWLNMITACT